MAEERPKREDTDPLYLDTVYPDAYEVFGFAPRPLKDVLANAVFVLDTNALLVPYERTPQASTLLGRPIPSS